jgi:hypothetical protein
MILIWRLVGVVRDFGRPGDERYMHAWGGGGALLWEVLTEITRRPDDMFATTYSSLDTS